MTSHSPRPLPKFPSKAFLAPMAGVSDPALRLICKELGAGLVVTEFTNIHAIVAKNSQLSTIKQFIEYHDSERPLSIQLFGSDLNILEQAVKIVSPHFDIIDYNMGCPAPHITEQMACSTLLQHPDLTRKIFKTIVRATDKPVTVKIRAGITSPDKWQDIAAIAQQEGLSMITFHPRTVKQGYAGKSDWQLIKQLKQHISIPIVGNGDITSPEDAKRMLDETGCDYIMLGRAAMSNPFIFQQINDYLTTGTYQEITLPQRLNVFFRYLDYAQNYPTISFATIRLHAMNFTKSSIGSKELRMQIGKTKNIDELKKLLKETEQKYQPEKVSP